MNHRPFEDWLLENQSLTPDQNQDLNNHLKICTSCKALTEVDLMLKAPQMAGPQAGFTDRFQFKLAAEKHLLRKRQRWGLGILGLISFITLGFVVVQLLSIWQNYPAEILVRWVTWWITLFSSFKTFGTIGLVFLKVASDFIPLPMWLGIIGGSFLLVLIWVTSLWKLSYSTNARRMA